MADPIWTGPTRFDTGKRWERVCVDIWMLTKWHVARAIQLYEIAPRAQTGKPIDTGKAAFYSSLREEDDNTGGTSLCIK